MKNDKRIANIEKYKSVLGTIGKSNKLPGADRGHEIDLGVAYEMLCEIARSGNYNTYKGVPANFDWNGFAADIEQ